MKTSFLPRIALLAGALGLAGANALLADDAPTDAPPPPPHGHHAGNLTPDEQAEMKKDRDAVFAANPDLKTQEKNLCEQMHQLQDKIDAAIVQQDPAAAAIIAKIKADHHHGPPPGDNQ